MKIAYFDCFAGVSGDMVLGALVDSGVELTYLQAELSKLGVNGFHLEEEKVSHHGIYGTKIHVITEEQKEYRHLKDILKIIENSSIASSVKEKSIQVFRHLAEAEAKVHNTTLEKIHFHEVGALDAIVDIVGSLIGLEKLGFDKIYSSAISTGSGFVDCEHGRIPVPVPATLELLKNIPVKSSGIESELATPTGAALFKTIVNEFGMVPSMKIESIGYGAGTKEFSIPNMLRLIIGNIEAGQFITDQVDLIETNIDDMNPEYYDYLIEKLFAAGALDVWLTPIIMKKTRPANTLSVLTESTGVDKLLEIIFSETTTLGVRMQKLQRRKIEREQILVNTRFGSIKVKVARLGDQIRSIAPEYDDCRKAAEDNNLPLQKVFEEVNQIARDMLQINTKETQ